ILQAIDTDASVSGHRIVFRAGDYPFLSSLVRNLGFGMDAMNRNWRTWVIGFSNRKQKNLFDELGLKDFDQQDMGLLMIGIISASLGLLALFMLLRKSPLNDPLLKIHQRFLARLKRLDIKVKASSGPLDLLAAIQLRNKNLATAATPYLRLYMQLRYAQLKYTGKEKQRLLEYYRQFVRNART
ncbi:MAG: hypothetical protein KZQ58_11940, partial [gamma proteobacterium symbiont of Bathyaustriella thionipta]|nr:hypothetical protein [gamma proteobacterium symbiont of Bathyaustriella thionipta]